MQKIKFDFEATKERIYAPNSNVPIGAPVDQNGNIANDGNAYGIVLCKETENEKYWVRYNLVVMVAGYCDIIDAQAIWGDEYSAEAMAAMSDITFCDNHQLPTGAGGGGAVVVTFDISLVDEVLAVSNASMTPSEVREAMKTNAVVGVLNMNAGDLQGEDVCGCAVIYTGNMGPAFRASYVDVETGEIVYVITSNATSDIEYWVFNAEAYFG